jgi:hypothetical protein
MKTLLAIVAAILLLPIAAFCVFGFMATFEPTDRPEVFMAFRIGYGVAGVACLAGVVGLIWWTFLSRRISGA